MRRLQNRALPFPGRSGDGGCGEWLVRECLCGFCELLNWGPAKLLKATSGVWAPGMCLFLTSQKWVVFYPRPPGVQASGDLVVGGQKWGPET